MRPFGNHYGCLLLQTSQVSLGRGGIIYEPRRVLPIPPEWSNSDERCRKRLRYCFTCERLRLPHPTRGLNCFAQLTTEIWACSKVLSPLPASACADVITVTLDCKITKWDEVSWPPKRICAVEKNKTQIYSEAQKSLAASGGGENTISKIVFLRVFQKMRMHRTDKQKHLCL